MACACNNDQSEWSGIEWTGQDWAMDWNDMWLKRFMVLSHTLLQRIGIGTMGWNEAMTKRRVTILTLDLNLGDWMTKRGGLLG